MAHHPFSSPEVQAAFDAYPQPIRKRLLVLRDLILDAGAEQGVGALEESLKWGEPAWRPRRARIGTTVRAAPYGARGSDIAMFVHCQTSLADQYRDAYPDQLELDGDRAVVFRSGAPLPRAIVRHCAAMAFTYHLRNR